MEIYKKIDCFALELDMFEILDFIKGLELSLEEIKRKPPSDLLGAKWQDDAKRIEKLIEQLNHQLKCS